MASSSPCGRVGLRTIADGDGGVEADEMLKAGCWSAWSLDWPLINSASDGLAASAASMAAETAIRGGGGGDVVVVVVSDVSYFTINMESITQVFAMVNISTFAMHNFKTLQCTRRAPPARVDQAFHCRSLCCCYVNPVYTVILGKEKNNNKTEKSQLALAFKSRISGSIRSPILYLCIYSSRIRSGPLLSSLESNTNKLALPMYTTWSLLPFVILEISVAAEHCCCCSGDFVRISWLSSDIHKRIDIDKHLCFSVFSFLGGGSYPPEPHYGMTLFIARRWRGFDHEHIMMIKSVNGSIKEWSTVYDGRPRRIDWTAQSYCFPGLADYESQSVWNLCAQVPLFPYRFFSTGWNKRGAKAY